MLERAWELLHAACASFLPCCKAPHANLRRTGAKITSRPSQDRVGAACERGAVPLPAVQGTGQLEGVAIADWTPQTLPTWRHSNWVGVWDPWPVILKFNPLVWYKVRPAGALPSPAWHTA